MNDEKSQDRRNPVVVFAVKLVIFFAVLVVAFQFLPPSFDELEQPIKRLLTERNKILLLGLVQNPAALYKASELAEKQGFPDAALRDMELAVGLVELHTTDKRVAKRYYDRLEALKSKSKTGS